MAIYVFTAGAEIAEVKVKPVTDLEIRINNKLIKTGKNFGSMKEMLLKLRGKKEADILTTNLNSIFDKFLITEFARMGYSLAKKVI